MFSGFLLEFLPLSLAERLSALPEGFDSTVSTEGVKDSVLPSPILLSELADGTQRHSERTSRAFGVA